MSSKNLMRAEIGYAFGMVPHLCIHHRNTFEFYRVKNNLSALFDKLTNVTLGRRM